MHYEEKVIAASFLNEWTLPTYHPFKFQISRSLAIINQDLFFDHTKLSSVCLITIFSASSQLSTCVFYILIRIILRIITVIENRSPLTMVLDLEKCERSRCDLQILAKFVSITLKFIPQLYKSLFEFEDNIRHIKFGIIHGVPVKKLSLNLRSNLPNN